MYCILTCSLGHSEYLFWLLVMTKMALACKYCFMIVSKLPKWRFYLLQGMCCLYCFVYPKWTLTMTFYRYYTDPSGTFWQCNAKAIGSGSEGADSSLQEQYNKVSLFLLILKVKVSTTHLMWLELWFESNFVNHWIIAQLRILWFLQDLTLKEAETIALSILKQVMEEKVNCI